MYEAHAQTLNYQLGTVMSTSAGFIKEMNKVSNQFAATLSTDLLEHLHQQLTPASAQR